MNNEDINKQIKEFLELKAQTDKIKERMDFIKANLVIDFEANNLDYYEDLAGNDISIKSQSRKSLNKKLVEERMAPNVFDECFKETTFNVVSIRSKERREALMSFKKKK